MYLFMKSVSCSMYIFVFFEYSKSMTQPPRRDVNPKLCRMPAGGRIGREDAAALLWGDANASSARNNLRQTLFVLRKALGPAARVLDADATTLSLSADVVVDVA